MKSFDATLRPGQTDYFIGFEMRNLRDFIQRLQAKGIQLREPYRRVPEPGNIGVAKLTDPSGTSIELTEGMRDLTDRRGTQARQTTIKRSSAGGHQ